MKEAMLDLLGALEQLPAAPEPDGPFTYEYVTRRGWGHDFTLEALDDTHARGSLFHARRPRVGDLLVLPATARAGDTTRYRITAVRPARGTWDLTFWDAELHPRTMQEKADDHLAFGLLTPEAHAEILAALPAPTSDPIAVAAEPAEGA